MIRLPLAACLALAAAACSEPAPAPVVNETAAPTQNYVAAVAALSPEARRGVLFRAIRDAGLPCQGVTEELADTAMRGNPVWRARCSDGQYHLIQVAPNGNATVISRAGR